MWANAEYIITLNADGTGSGSYDMGYGPTTFDITATLYIGDVITMKTVTTGEYGGTAADIEFTYSPNTLTSAQALMWGELVLTPYSGDVGGGDDEDDTPVYDTTIVAGENTLWFSTDEVTADTATRPLTITEAGNYQFNAGALFVSAITDASGNPVAKNEDFTYTLAAGEYTVTFGMLSMFSVPADTAQVLNVVNNNAGGEDIGGGEDTDEPDGSSEKPYVLPQAGDYTCEFPGGGPAVWYTFTPTEGGYVTVSSTFATAWLQAGISFYDLKGNEGDATPVKVYVQANVACYIGIADWDETVVDVPFTVTFEAGELVADGTTSAPYPVVLDTQTTANFTGDSPIWYYYTTSVGGYLTVTTTYANANIQVGPDFYNTVSNVSFDMETYQNVIAPSIRVYVTAGSTYYIGVYDNDYLAADIAFTVTFEEFTSESAAFLEGTWTGSEPAYGYEAVYNVVLGADGTGYGSYDMGYGPTTFDVTFALVDGNTVTLYTVTTGEYGGSSVNIEFTYDAAAGTLTTDKGMMDGALVLTAGTGSEGGDEGGSGSTDEPNGTQSKPYVVDQLPYTITVDGNHDVYYTYTATEATVITISYDAGNYISITGGVWEKDSTNRIYTVTVAAGEVISINPWGSNSGSYTIAVAEATTPEEGGDEEGGDEGGEVSGTTYLATNANGRKMQVVVYSDGTMTVTRSDITGNFTGGATTANYTWEMVGGVFTFTKVGNNSITAMEFSEDGVPVSVTWSGAVYEGFTLQV